MRKHLLARMKLAGQYAKMVNKALHEIEVCCMKRALEQRANFVLQGGLTEPAGPLN